MALHIEKNGFVSCHLMMPSFSICNFFHGKRREVYGKRPVIQIVCVGSSIAYMLDLL